MDSILDVIKSRCEKRVLGKKDEGKKEHHLPHFLSEWEKLWEVNALFTKMHLSALFSNGTESVFGDEGPSFHHESSCPSCVYTTKFYSSFCSSLLISSAAVTERPDSDKGDESTRKCPDERSERKPTV